MAKPRRNPLKPCPECGKGMRQIRIHGVPALECDPCKPKKKENDDV